MPVPPNGATLDDVVEAIENAPAPPAPEGAATEITLAAVQDAAEGILGAVGLEVTQQLVLDELGDQSVHLETLATAAASTDPAAIVFDTATMRAGTTSLTPKFAKITASSSGDTPVVAAVTDKKIRVLGYVLTMSATVNAKFRSATTDITGLLYKGAAPGMNPLGHFETAAAEALNINLSGAVAVGGHLVYVEV